MKGQCHGIAVFTWLHVAISIIAILTGPIVVYGLIAGQPMDAWTIAFLTTTLLTSATGFGFPFERFLPSHVLWVISLVVLGTSILARYVFDGKGCMALDLRGHGSLGASY